VPPLPLGLMREMKLLWMRSKTLVAKSQNGRILMSLSGEVLLQREKPVAQQNQIP